MVVAIIHSREKSVVLGKGRKCIVDTVVFIHCYFMNQLAFIFILCSTS